MEERDGGKRWRKEIEKEKESDGDGEEDINEGCVIMFVFIARNNVRLFFELFWRTT
jgi:hypothetical protein